MKYMALWLAALALVVLGLIGTIAPGLPGVLLIYGGMWLAAWIDGYSRVGWPTLLMLGALTLLTFIVDLLSSLLGAKKVGASRQALLGSVFGGFVGIPLGIAGLIIGPFVGAFLGEYWARRQLNQATRVGVGTWLGLVAGTLVKIALAVAMLGVFAAGYFI